MISEVPYSDLAKATPAYPVGDLLVDYATIDAWKASEPDECKLVERRLVQLGKQNLADGLIDHYCLDKQLGKTHANGFVFADLKSQFTLQQLEAEDYWGQLQQKAQLLGKRQ